MISVAICTFNGDKYIQKQLLSILNQTVPIDEIVICDDRSKDNTIQTINTIALNNQSVSFNIIINDTNIGVRNNFEKAIKECNGDYIFLSDQDDVWCTNKVETIINYFTNHPEKDVVISNAYLIDSNDNLLTEKKLFDCVGLSPEIINLSNNDNLIDLFLDFNRATGSTMALRKSVPIHFNFNTQILHDYILAIEALSRNSFGIIEQPLNKYRIHKKQERGIGEAISQPWESSIYDYQYERTNGYYPPKPFADKIQMRNRRYKWIAGRRGFFTILKNWRLYKSIYPYNWRSFIRFDLKNTLNQYEQRLKKKIIN